MKLNRNITNPLTQEEIEEINKRQVEIHNYLAYWKYNYDEYDKKGNYNYKLFGQPDFKKRNYNYKYTNFELQYRNSEKIFYLHIPTIAFQALGVNQAIMLCELARLSKNFPVNRYGFILVDAKEITKDTGLSYSQQVKASDYLEQWGFINVHSYDFPIALRFYRFNDDFATKAFKHWMSIKGIRDWNIGLQYKKSSNKNGKEKKTKKNHDE